MNPYIRDKSAEKQAEIKKIERVRADKRTEKTKSMRQEEMQTRQEETEQRIGQERRGGDKKPDRED